jgi:dihydrodipicolinate synthase/N-acetylneuraminate lyase
MALGIDWAVGSTYNFLSNVVHRMVESFNRSDLYTARVEQKRVQDVIRIRDKYGRSGLRALPPETNLRKHQLNCLDSGCAEPRPGGPMKN